MKVKKEELTCLNCNDDFSAKFEYIMTCPNCGFVALYEKFVE